jgi:hypothetical protein
MQTAAKISRVFTEVSSIQRFANPLVGVGKGGSLRESLLGHLAQVVLSRTAFGDLAGIGIRLAENAYSFRDTSTLDEASAFLMNLPASGAYEIGAFYRALALKRKGSPEPAKALFETIADRGPLAYRARAIQALGAISRDQQDLRDALQLQLEALRMATSLGPAGLQTCLMTRLSAAAIQSDCGDHRGALCSLQALSPLVQAVAKSNPFYFYIYQNALAVELGEVGHFREASYALSIALKSPYASAYPEILETRDELEAKRRSSTSSPVTVDPLASPSQTRKHHKEPRQPAPDSKAATLRSPAPVKRSPGSHLIASSSKPAAVGPIQHSAVAFDQSDHPLLQWLGKSSQPRAPPAVC